MQGDILFIACTRPALKGGVPYEGFMLNFCGVVVAAIVIGNPFYAIVGIPIHLGMRLLTEIDHNFFRIGRLWLNTKGRAVARSEWGGSMLSPMSCGPRDVSGAL